MRHTHVAARAALALDAEDMATDRANRLYGAKVRLGGNGIRETAVAPLCPDMKKPIDDGASERHRYRDSNPGFRTENSIGEGEVGRVLPERVGFDPVRSTSLGGLGDTFGDTGSRQHLGDPPYAARTDHQTATRKPAAAASSSQNDSRQ
jgi:hypothetical protein